MSRMRRGAGSVWMLVAGMIMAIALAGVLAVQLPDAFARADRTREASSLDREASRATTKLRTIRRELANGREALGAFRADTARVKARVDEQERGLRRLERERDALEERLEELGG